MNTYDNSKKVGVENQLPPSTVVSNKNTDSQVFVVRSPQGALISLAELQQSIQKNGSIPEPEIADATKHTSNLGQWRSTSIAGNDLLSSCLYTAGICASYAGKMSPLSLLLVSVMLYFFRFVYGEVVTALPINGGSYTALSNTTSKRVASIAASLSLLSYIATAVVSAESAINYLQLIVPSINTHTGTMLGTIAVLALFAFLNILGLSESANVAMVMFFAHLFTLIVLIVWSFIWACQNDWVIFKENLDTPYPSNQTWAPALYFGYAAALLGITGFETAANYVEEMTDSTVYVKTLRNLWVLVAIINPLLGVLAMAVMPLSEMYNYTSNLLGPMANVVGGSTLRFVVCLDGAIVLMGSVLTGYVGVVSIYDLVQYIGLYSIIANILHVFM